MKKRILAGFTAILMALTILPLGAVTVFADGEVHYTREATGLDLGQLPGVYEMEAKAGDSKEGDNPATIGIPTVAKQTLADRPTRESPAIIMGAAVNYEKKIGPTEYQAFDGANLLAPYKYFRWRVIDEQIQEPDGSTSTHKKLSGFDGSYYIVRVNLTELLDGIENPAGKYLHVRQDDNKALMVAMGFNGTTYANGLGSKTGSYSLKHDFKALKDDGEHDIYADTPYLDVIILSSGKLAAGADAGSANAPNGDIKLSFYVDDRKDYHPELEALDPDNMPTWPYTPPGSDTEYKTEADYNTALLTKFFDENAQNKEREASYIVKGSDLEIDVTVAEQEGGFQPAPKQDFWSMTKAMDYPAYNNHIIKLICKVPVPEGLSIQGSNDNKRNVILDVNSYDIQIANNTEQNKAGLTIGGNASLRIQDGTQTSGAELAIGNNASMVIKKDGVLVIDESCTNEVEYDAATVADPTQDPGANLFNGEITIEEGGQLINYGVVNIEGMEAKPVDPNQQQEGQVVTDMKTAEMIVREGGLLQNFGCISLKGVLYVMGTLINFGRYNDIIKAHDPDKGTTEYHKGIQVTWKDVVTREGVQPGVLNVGIDADGNKTASAAVINLGDMVFFPGTLNNYGMVYNATLGTGGRIFFCAANEAIIPVIDPNDPLHVEDRIVLDPPKKSVFNNQGTLQQAPRSLVGTGIVELIHNGVPGELIPFASLEKAKEALSKNTFSYTGSVQKPRVTKVTLGGKTLTAGKDYSVKYSNPSSKEIGRYTVEIIGAETKEGPYAGKAVAEYTIGKKSLKDAKIVLSADQSAYNGKVQKPSVKSVTLGNAALKEGTDFTVAYSNANSKNAGTYKVTVTGAGHYSGSADAAYQIKPASVKKAKIVLSETAYHYNGAVQKPMVESVKMNGALLKLGRDYTAKYSNKKSSAVGKYSIVITGLGNYSDQATAKYAITKAHVNASVTLSKKSFVYNGKVRKPTVKKVTMNGETLKKGKDYTVSYSDPSSKNVGYYTVSVKGKGKFTGTVKKAYKITKAANPMTLKVKSAKVSSKKLKKQAKTFFLSRVLKITNAKGKVFVQKLSGNKKIKLNPKNGMIKIAKGAKPGRYKVEIRVKAAGNANYKAAAKTVQVVIIVK